MLADHLTGTDEPRLNHNTCGDCHEARNERGMSDHVYSDSPGALTRVWRPSDVAAFWQRCPTTVWRWVEAGQHPAPRTDPGGRPYWLPDDVLRFAGVDVPTVANDLPRFLGSIGPRQQHSQRPQLPTAHLPQ